MEKDYTVTLRRLDPLRDKELVRESLAWIKDEPRWFRDGDEVWGTEDFKAHLANMMTQARADVGVFEGKSLIAVINVSLVGKDVYNVHLMAKRGVNAESLIVAALNVKKELFGNGAREVWAWPEKRNKGVQRILEAIGMVRDGVELIKGQSHGRPITWTRYWTRCEA